LAIFGSSDIFLVDGSGLIGSGVSTFVGASTTFSTYLMGSGVATFVGGSITALTSGELSFF